MIETAEKLMDITLTNKESAMRKKTSLTLFFVLILFLNIVYAQSKNNLNYGIQLFESKKYDQAKVFFSKYLETNQDNAEIYFYLGRINFISKNYDKAYNNIFNALKLDMDNAKYHYWYAFTIDRKNEAIIIDESPERINTYNPPMQQIEQSELKFLYNKMISCLHADEYSEENKKKALNYAKLLKESDLERGYQAFQDIYQKENKLDLLEYLYIDRIRDFPESVIYKIELAQFYSDILRDHERSFKYFEKILQEHSNSRVVLYAYGKTCAKTGENLGRGIECLTNYLKFHVQLYPDLAHYYLGETYFKKGDKNRAIIEYEKALKINPENKKAKRSLNRIK